MDQDLSPSRDLKCHDDTANGLFAGAEVFTLDGVRSVETLKPGDRIITRDSGTAILREIKGVRREVPAVRITAQAFGPARPERDAIVAASARVNIRDWAAERQLTQAETLVHADNLVDGRSITRLPRETRETFQLVFDAAHILYVDGLEIGTASTAAR